MTQLDTDMMAQGGMGQRGVSQGGAVAETGAAGRDIPGRAVLVVLVAVALVAVLMLRSHGADLLPGAAEMRLVPVAAGLLLLMVAVPGLYALGRMWRRILLLRAAAAVIAAEGEPALIADAAGVIHARNPPAGADENMRGDMHGDMRRDRPDDGTGEEHGEGRRDLPILRPGAGSGPGATIPALLAQIFADPAVTARTLQAQAREYGSAREDMMTRHGPLRVSVTSLGADLFLWRLTRPPPRAAPRDDIALPFLTAGPGGAVLYMNPAFRRLTGAQARDLADVFADLPLESGRRHMVKGADGPVSCLVATIDGSGGRREIYLLPGAAAPADAEGEGIDGEGSDRGSIGRGGVDRAENGWVESDRAEIDRDKTDRAKTDWAKTDWAKADWDGTDWAGIGALPIPLLMLSPGGRIRAANNEARSLLPMAIGPDTRLADLVEGPGRPVADWLRDAAEGRGDDQPQFLRGTGPHRDLFLRVTLSAAGRGRGRHILAILADVTEYKTLEAQFVQSQKMEAIGQLAGGIAHDFNNLLTAISGHCDLLLLRRDEGDPDWPDLEQIRQNTNRAAALVGQLLAFSRKQSLTPEVLDLPDILADLTHLLNRLIGEKVRLVLDHDPALRPIRADRRQLEQVIMNLVVNARDAMPAGGQIRIETGNHHLDTPLERDRARVPAGDHVVVRVTDHGSGIPPERIGRIFEPFYTTKRAGEGTGLGLSTAYGIVKQTGGFIFADSQPGAGTAFSLWFPASSETPATGLPPARAAPRPSGPPARCTVLLVEDEAPVRAFAARALRLRGHHVLEADSAEAALALLDDPALQVDVFLSDVVMPGKDGPTWVREALATRPETRVIFVSGYADGGQSGQRAEIPGAAFLPKPFSLTDLAETVRSLAA